MKRVLTAVTIAGLTVAGLTPAAAADDQATLTAAVEAKAKQAPRLGEPASAFETADSYGLVGVYRRYQHGVVAATSRGAFIVESGLQTAWTPSDDGWPAQDTQTIRTISGLSGAAAYFVKPSLGAAQELGAGYAVTGGIGYFVAGESFVKFAAVGGLAGAGWPTSEQVAAGAYGAQGWYQKFTRMTIASSLSTGTHILGFGIQVGWTPSWGWPSQDTQKIAKVNGYTGFAQRLRRPSAAEPDAAAYQTTGGSAYVVSGAMFDRFTTLGGLSGPGWPMSAETPLARCGTSSQRFSASGTLRPDGRWCPAATYASPYLAQASNGTGNVQYPGYNGTAVYLMQRAVGMNPRKISDRWGAGTQAALDAYLKRHGYPASTRLDATVWGRLNSPYPFNVSTWVAPLAAPASATRAQHVAAAIRFARANLGVDYLWGATGNPGAPIGYDCAGLLLQAYRSGGVNITKVTNWHDQYPPSDMSNKLLHDSELQPVASLSSLLPGDLLFSGTYDKNGAAHARHVMMYIGNGMTIQAIHTGVTYVPLRTKGRLYTGGWPYLVGIRRPFATAEVGGPIAAAPAASIPQTPLASVPQPPGATYWQINSWAVALPQQSAGPMSRPAWRPVVAGEAVTTRGDGTLIFAGGGSTVQIVTRAGGAYHVPAGADRVLMLSPSDAAGVAVGSPVVSVSAGRQSGG